MKDQIEGGVFFERQDLLPGLDLVFFDTTSICFEGEWRREAWSERTQQGHRPDLNQVVTGVVIDTNGKPVCCEIWPGNTADVKTLIPVVERIRGRFHIGQFCLVADRGMISAETVGTERKKDSVHFGSQNAQGNRDKRRCAIPSGSIPGSISRRKIFKRPDTP